MRLEVRVKGAKEYREALAKMDPKRNPRPVSRGLRKAGRILKAEMRANLQGPSPRRLEVDTGVTLRGVQIDESGLPFSIEVGPNIEQWWLENYELGRGIRGKRPFTKPAISESLKDIPGIMLAEWEKSVQ